MPASGEDYSKWSVSELKSGLQELGVTSSGTKQSLVNRLIALAPSKALLQKRVAKCKVPETKTAACAKSSAKTKVRATCLKSKVSAKLVRTKPAVAAAKCPSGKKMQ